MDAGSRTLMGLVSEVDVRFVVPVYQRPYSWGERQCAQLWDDVLACGRGSGAPHFTGSIVTVREPAAAGTGVASLLLIDGQQRITTVMLLLVALARYADAHPGEPLAFSRAEIVEGGYLANRFRTGDDHHKLTLSKGDRATWRTLVERLEGADVEVDPASPRLLGNLALLERRIDALADVDSLWRGLRRLEVVSIALAQGSDDAQAIFESMNATGKDLACADLVRNYVLMGYPLSEQGELYRTYWRPLERTLAARGGAGSFEEAFDDFARCYLAVAQAPARLSPGDDLYLALKRHVRLRGYDRDGRIAHFALRLKRLAGRYADVVSGEVAGDAELGRALGRVEGLGATAVRPLLLALLDAHDRQDLSREALLASLGLLESFLVRRAVCDCEPSALPQLVSSLVVRLGAVRAEGADVACALAAMLLNEEGTARRLPTDAEFHHALTTRDAYDLDCVGLLLARIEGALRADGTGLAAEGHVVERVLPPRALESGQWRRALGADPERAFAACVNNLGNLTLAPFDFELQDAGLEEKRARLRVEGLALSRDVLDAALWGPRAIGERAERLARAALALWPVPRLDEARRRAFRPGARDADARDVSFADLFDAGLVQMDDALVSASPPHPGRARVTSRGRIMLADGESFDDPDEAFARLLGSLGASETGLSGWLYWRRGEGGPTLDDLRARLS